jgi:hypothetical protein
MRIVKSVPGSGATSYGYRSRMSKILGLGTLVVGALSELVKLAGGGLMCDPTACSEVG